MKLKTKKHCLAAVYIVHLTYGCIIIIITTISYASRYCTIVCRLFLGQ